MSPSTIHAYRPETHMWPAPANSFLLTDSDGAILIDAGCGSPEAYDKLRAFIVKLQGEERIECPDWGSRPLFSLTKHDTQYG
ncbi:MAG: MBL fold metallo-hydrolase [Actinobacteria bacterium]|nr:MBL fold metallo-hydrolase [Actinomycetota bacterium]MBU4391314.1 MBL fold metallo-hydrolase [Actinomycetota bacterium]MBU4441948.1 MBL fold metallo-hydrolase [Actinomycetota bacterium]